MDYQKVIQYEMRQLKAVMREFKVRMPKDMDYEL